MRCQCSRNTRIDRVQSTQVQVTGITGELRCGSGGKRRDAVQPECRWAHEVGEPVKSVRKCLGHVERQRGQPTEIEIERAPRRLVAAPRLSIQCPHVIGRDRFKAAQVKVGLALANDGSRAHTQFRELRRRVKGDGVWCRVRRRLEVDNPSFHRPHNAAVPCIERVGNDSEKTVKLRTCKRCILKGNSDIGPDLAILRVVLEPYHFRPPLDSGEHFQGSRRVLAFRQVERLGGINMHVFPVLEELEYQRNS